MRSDDDAPRFLFKPARQGWLWILEDPPGNIVLTCRGSYQIAWTDGELAGYDSLQAAAEDVREIVATILSAGFVVQDERGHESDLGEALS